ncbi:MAG: ABC transporter ATP-binding protein [Gaiellaceae bacterium]
MSAVPATTDQALEVVGLSKYFDVPGSEHFWQPRRKLHAVDDVSFTLAPGTITALVGESGSGKTTVARLIARLYEPTSGKIVFEGLEEPRHVNRTANLRYRRQVQMIFQDPFDSLNPVKTVSYLIGRPLRIHKIVPRGQEQERVHELLETVGLIPPEVVAAKYPHELSGGQRQRVAIARALAVTPRVILADEPTSMLDVSIRIGILNLMIRLKEEHNLAFLFVTHDLASARYVADELLVMYSGQIVERGPTEKVLADPLHPYTRLLISAAPDPNAGLHTRKLAARTPQDLAVEQEGACRFVGRCPLAIDICSTTPPVLAEAGLGRMARCHVTAPGRTK